MQPFKQITGKIAYLPIPNIDTDMIIPKQYLKTIQRTGLGRYLFAEMRFDKNDEVNRDFILNHSDFKQANILLTEKNFGCGSSREHAVWSLLDFGIRVVIAPSFADIFYSNCFKNGLLPIILSSDIIVQIIRNKDYPVTVDLILQKIITQSLEISFSLEEDRRDSLLKGLDEIHETLQYEEKIAAFEKNKRLQQPWLFYGESSHE